MIARKFQTQVRRQQFLALVQKALAEEPGLIVAVVPNIVLQFRKKECADVLKGVTRFHFLTKSKVLKGLPSADLILADAGVLSFNPSTKRSRIRRMLEETPTPVWCRVMVGEESLAGLWPSP